ncbi:hypothetical protein GN956_G4125 [Arapaima gigas]
MIRLSDVHCGDVRQVQPWVRRTGENQFRGHTAPSLGHMSTACQWSGGVAAIFLGGVDRLVPLSAGDEHQLAAPRGGDNKAVTPV